MARPSFTKSLFLSIVAVAASAPLAQAASLTAGELLSQYNLITTGDVTGNGGFHVDGRVLVGGDWLAGPSTVVYMNGKGAESGFADAIIAGDVAQPTHVNNGGDAVAGSGLDNLNMNGGGSKSSYTAASAPTGYGTVLGDYAQTLAGYAETSANITRQGSIHDPTNTYDVAGVEIGVLSLLESDIRADRDMNFNLGAGVEWLVVNVTATADKIFSLGSAFKAQQSASIASKVIWNFVGFDQVIFDAQFTAGAILAQGAEVVTNAGNIEASVFSDSFRGLSELHYVGLANGDLPGTTTDMTQPAPVPLPAGMPLLLLGLGVFGVVARRRA